MSLSDAIDRITTQNNEIYIAYIRCPYCVVHSIEKLTLEDIHICMIESKEGVIRIVESLTYSCIVGRANTD